MGKKRRVWWIVGAAVVFFGCYAHLSVYNSTDARIKRAVAQIVEEYGFELHARAPGRRLADRYSTAPVDEETADEIVAILREGCPSLDDRSFLLLDRHPGLVPDFGHPVEVHFFVAEEQHGHRTVRIKFNPAHGGLWLPGYEPGASLVVHKFDRPSLWQRIKGLWPWWEA